MWMEINEIILIGNKPFGKEACYPIIKRDSRPG